MPAIPENSEPDSFRAFNAAARDALLDVAWDLETKGMSDAAQLVREKLRMKVIPDFVVDVRGTQVQFWAPRGIPRALVAATLRDMADAMESGEARRIE